MVTLSCGLVYGYTKIFNDIDVFEWQLINYYITVREMNKGDIGW